MVKNYRQQNSLLTTYIQNQEWVLTFGKILLLVAKNVTNTKLTERPKKEIREFISARKFDVLIDLTQEPSRTMKYMAMDIRADFKVGRFIQEGIHDLTIDTPSQATPDYLFEQIVKYIEMFGGK